MGGFNLCKTISGEIMSEIYVRILGFKNDEIRNSIVNSIVFRKYKFNRTERFIGKVGKLLDYDKPLYIVGFIEKWSGHISIYKMAVFEEEIERVDESEAKEFKELFNELNAKVVAEKL